MLRIWQEINWFMRWIFWRDSYWNRKVEAIGFDRVVLRSDEWYMELYNWDPEILLEEYNKQEGILAKDI